MSRAKKKAGRVRRPVPRVRGLQSMVEPVGCQDAPTANRHAELLRLERRQFTTSGRTERVSRALEALRGLRVDFNLGPETLRWIAQDADIEEF
jgi:hypothetical protein